MENENFAMLKGYPKIDFNNRSIRVKAANLDTEQDEDHVISFLEFALKFEPHGKGQIIVPIPYLSSDVDTGITEDYREIPTEPYEFLKEIYDDNEVEFQMLQKMKSDYQEQIDICLLSIIERRYLIKINYVTC